GVRNEPVLPLAFDKAVEADTVIYAAKRLQFGLPVTAARDVYGESRAARQADRADQSVDSFVGRQLAHVEVADRTVRTELFAPWRRIPPAHPIADVGRAIWHNAALRMRSQQVI